MENKKLLKFLLKDLVEIEELFAEKGSTGFDAYELEFLQTRFKGAKQIIQILEDKEAENLNEQQTAEPVIPETEKEEVIEEVADEIPKEAEAPQAVEPPEESNVKEKVKQAEEEVEVIPVAEISEAVQETIEQEMVEEEKVVEEEPTEVTDETAPEVNDDLEMEDEPEEAVGRTLGDSFLKGQSVNDLMANGNGSGKLENKLSNSPVDSIQRAIGINDRYLYIRELFSGDADVFTKTVSDLDNLTTIQEAVGYLQQNYKWKKNETSLKFVNLVKRRFPNG